MDYLLGLNELFFVESSVLFASFFLMIDNWLFPWGILEVQQVV